MGIKVEDRTEQKRFQVHLHVEGFCWPLEVSVPDLDPNTVAMGIAAALAGYIDHPNMGQFAADVAARVGAQESPGEPSEAN